MLRSMHSPDPSDAHLRQLLDQRTARADPFGRYSTISEASDTPSVYSRAFFSPRPADKPHSDSLTDDYPYKSPTSHPNRRLLDDPSSSMLDLDEDVRLSMALSGSYGRDDEDDDQKTIEEDGDDDALPRMSYLGPKMRFHSRAPWELEDETVQEVDETESSGHSSFIGILTGGRSKGSKADSSSPRPSTAAGRPSLESSRSLLNPKRSFDTSSLSHPRGALYALAQESLSTSSLGRANHSGRQDGMRGKFSLGRLRSHSANVDIPSSPDQPVTRLPSHDLPPAAPLSPRTSYDTTSSTLDVQAGLHTRYTERRSDDGIHPYANPDLVVSYATGPPPKSPLRPTLQHPGVSRNDSNMTVTENCVSSIIPKPVAKAVPTLETTVSAPSKKRMSHIQGRDISSPVSVHNPLLHPDSPGQQHNDTRHEPVPPLPLGAGAIPGWSDRTINPGFSLISLEEARAQRTRPVPVQPPPPFLDSSPSSGESSATTSFHSNTQENFTTPAGASSDLNPLYFPGDSVAAVARSRARSISAGTKAKNALQSFVRQPERRGSENSLATGQTIAKDAGAGPGAKGLKHKKSGFMRLFGNGGKEERPPPVPSVPPQLPPLVPALPEGHPVPRHNPKLSSHRIPVPSLSPSLLEAVAQYEGGDSSSDSHTISRITVSPKRTLPPLSINIGSSPTPVSPPSHGGLTTTTSSQSTIPQSAPPHVSDFPTLKLRPVSTLFSAHFGEHIDVTKLNFDDLDGIGPKETRDDAISRQQERPRQDSLASGSVSSAPSSASAASFTDSQCMLSPAASSYTSTTGTALTTPTTGGVTSPVGKTGPWSRDRDFGASGRISVDQYSTSPSSSHINSNLAASHVVKDNDATTIRVLQEHLDNTNKMWQKRVWDLESQITELKNEVAELKGAMSEGERPYCNACGGKALASANSGAQSQSLLQPPHQQQAYMNGSGVMNRPRVRTGGSSRFVNGQL